VLGININVNKAVLNFSIVKAVELIKPCSVLYTLVGRHCAG
jgi:hypothetical protein